MYMTVKQAAEKWEVHRQGPENGFVFRPLSGFYMQLEMGLYLFLLLMERSTAIITTTSIRRMQEAMRTMVIVLLSDFFVSSLTGSSSWGVVSGAGVDSSIVSEGVSVSGVSVSLSVSVSVVVSEPLSFGVGV